MIDKTDGPDEVAERGYMRGLRVRDTREAGNVGLTLPSKYLPCSLDRAGHKIYNYCLLVPVIIEPRIIYLLDVRQEMVYLHKRCVATV